MAGSIGNLALVVSLVSISFALQAINTTLGAILGVLREKLK